MMKKRSHGHLGGIGRMVRSLSDRVGKRYAKYVTAYPVWVDAVFSDGLEDRYLESVRYTECK